MIGNHAQTFIRTILRVVSFVCITQQSTLYIVNVAHCKLKCSQTYRFMIALNQEMFYSLHSERCFHETNENCFFDNLMWISTYSYDVHEGTQTDQLPWTILRKCKGDDLSQLYNFLGSAESTVYYKNLDESKSRISAPQWSAGIANNIWGLRSKDENHCSNKY